MSKRAVIYNPFWDTFGGGERYTASFISLLLKQGWHVDVYWASNISSTIQSLFDIDISKSNFMDFPLNFTLASLNYDLVFWLSDGSLPTSLAKKTIIHFQFPFQNLKHSYITEFLKTKNYNFVCNSNFTKSFIDSEYKVNSKVIYPPITPVQRVAKKKTNTILYVGRFSQLTQLKNQHLLVSAFSKIYKQLKGWRLCLVGGTGVGTDEKYFIDLKSSAKDLPIDIITNPKYTDLQNLYSQSKIFWSASGLGVDEKANPLQVEHFGMTVVESMSAGCVPLISNIGGHKEIVTSGSDGYLFNSLEELTELTLKIVHSTDGLLTLSENALIKSKIFSVDQFEKQYSLILQ